jgi:hypothetical protein
MEQTIRDAQKSWRRNREKDRTIADSFYLGHLRGHAESDDSGAMLIVSYER